MPIKLNTEGAIGTGIETDMYMKLCRNIDLRPPKETKELYCKYESKNKPYYMYGPRKVEVVSLSPHIAGTIQLYLLDNAPNYLIGCFI